MREQRTDSVKAKSGWWRGRSWIVCTILPAAMSLILGACGENGVTGTTTAAGGGTFSGDRTAGIAVAVPVGNAVVTVRALQDAFQPVTPAQKLSDETPVAPAAGESFYQAYVRVENVGALPVRVDPEHFACRIGNIISLLEPTRSGPPARSLINGTSLDLLLTFRGPAGQDPVLIYSPPWYDGVITFSPKEQVEVTTTAPSTTVPVTVQ